MKNFLKFLLFTLIAFEANAQEQEIGVYESNIVRRAETGDVYEITSVFTITKTSLIHSTGNSSAEYTFAGHPGQTTDIEDGYSTIYQYYSNSVTNRFAFEFMKNRSGQITQIDMYKIVPLPNAPNDDAGSLRLEAQFLINRRIN